MENVLVGSLARENVKDSEIQETIVDIQTRLTDVNLSLSQQAEFEQVMKDVTRDSFEVNGTPVEGQKIADELVPLLIKLGVHDADDVARDMLTASTRTVSGGDSYCVLQERFGGPRVLIRPHSSSSVQTPISIEIKTFLGNPSKSKDDETSDEVKENSANLKHLHIEIECCSVFEVYDKAMVESAQDEVN